MESTQKPFNMKIHAIPPSPTAVSVPCNKEDNQVLGMNDNTLINHRYWPLAQQWCIKLQPSWHKKKKKKNPQNHDLNSGVVFNEGCLLSVVPVFFQLWWAYVRILVQLTHSVSTPPPPNPLLIGSVNVCLSFLEVFMLRMVFKGDMYLNCLSSMLHTVNMCVDATS